MELLKTGEKLPDVEYQFREVCYGICVIDEKILVVYSEKDRNLSLPGGGIEQGESLDVAINREFVEEAGYKLKSAEEIVQVHSYWNWANGRRCERLAHIFVVDVDKSSKTEPTENWHTRLLVDFEDASKVVPFPYQKAGIEYYLSKFKG